MTRSDSSLPSIGEAIGPLLLALPREQQPLFIALAERRAAARYREWAAAVPDAEFAAALLQCAAREEDIAGRVEALYPDAAAVQGALLAAHAQFEALNLELFAGRPLPDQFRIQGNGERLGAATWRSFANAAPSDEARATFLTCAELEEASAVVLESFGNRR